MQTIRDKLPFLIDLTQEERRSLRSLGDKSRAFVAKALEVAQQNPDFLPRSFDIEEMARGVAVFETLQPVRTALTQLQELVEDTTHLVGSEAYVAALLVYDYAKSSPQGAGLDAVVDALGKRFARRSRRAAEVAA